MAAPFLGIGDMNIDNEDGTVRKRAVEADNLMMFHVVAGDEGYDEDEGEMPEHYTGPDCRSGHRIFVTEDYLYAIGGYERNLTRHEGIIYRDMWRFNLLTRKWTEMSLQQQSSFPTALASFALAQLYPYSSELIVHGGTALPFGVASSSNTYLLSVDPVRNTVHSKLIPVEGQVRRMYGHALVRGSGPSESPKFYAVGGTSGQHFFLDVDCLKIEKDTWSWTKEGVQPPDMTGLYRLEAIVVDDQLIMFGGGTPDVVKDLEKLTVFNLKTKEYGTLSTLPDTESEIEHGSGYPAPRRCHSVTQWGRNVIVAGGSSEDRIDEHGRKVDIYGDVWIYNLDSNRWTRYPHNLHMAVFFHDAAVSKDGCLFIFGGVADETSQFRVNLCQAIWLQPPPLLYTAARRLLKTHSLDGVIPDHELILSNPLNIVRKLASAGA